MWYHEYVCAGNDHHWSVKSLIQCMMWVTVLRAARNQPLTSDFAFFNVITQYKAPYLRSAHIAEILRIFHLNLWMKTFHVEIDLQPGILYLQHVNFYCGKSKVLLRIFPHWLEWGNENSHQIVLWILWRNSMQIHNKIHKCSLSKINKSKESLMTKSVPISADLLCADFILGTCCRNPAADPAPMNVP